MQLGKKLFQLRKNRKCSQHHLSLEISVSQTAYYKWEKGTTKPSVINLLKIATYYQILISELLGKTTTDRSAIIEAKRKIVLKRLIEKQNEITHLIISQNKMIEVFLFNY